MKWKLRLPSRRWLLIPPLLLGVAAAVLLIARRQPPRREAVSEAVHPLRVIEVTELDVIPRALGYGTAEPAQVWQAVSEVHGRVVEIHPQLQAGSMIKQGELLLRIDPSEYELAVAEIEADIGRVEAELEKLAIAEENDRASLKIEDASLAVAEAELQRLESLFRRNAASNADVDKQKRGVLAQRQGRQSVQNALRLVPQRRKSLESERAVKQAALRRAQLDVTRSVIRAPFDCRLGDVEIQLEQVLAAGKTLFEAHGTAVAEIEAQIPLDQLRKLIDPEHGVRTPVMMSPQTVQRLFNFQVLVRYQSGDFRVSWEGRVVRLREQLDPRTRTIGLIVAVDKPYEQAIPGQRPPLVQGMFCEVELRGKPQRQQLLIPRSALHDDHVYVVDHEHRLRRRPVTIAFTQSDFFCVQDGLEAGETLVVSDPTPVIEGSLTAPVDDAATAQRLAAQARGEGSPK
jgi:multidrug efflux pump subunit AcrA (membrane-fusion protein)